MGRLVTTQQAAAGRRAIIPQQTRSAVIRYNVTAVDGLFARRLCQPGGPCEGIQLRLRYLATGPGARVVARLIEVDAATGSETARLTFDSRAFGAASRYQVRSAGECGPAWVFDFKRKAYYVEATLTGSLLVVNSAAGVHVIKIDNFTCRS